MRQGIKEKDIRDFEKYAKKLNDVIERIQEYKPEANVYFANDLLNLLSGDSHDYYGNPQPDNVVTNVFMSDFDSGDW